MAISLDRLASEKRLATSLASSNPGCAENLAELLALVSADFPETSTASECPGEYEKP
jgi:hypothetical protein